MRDGNDRCEENGELQSHCLHNAGICRGVSAVSEIMVP